MFCLFLQRSAQIQTSQGTAASDEAEFIRLAHPAAVVTTELLRTHPQARTN